MLLLHFTSLSSHITSCYNIVSYYNVKVKRTKNFLCVLNETKREK